EVGVGPNVQELGAPAAKAVAQSKRGPLHPPIQIAPDPPGQPLPALLEPRTETRLTMGAQAPIDTGSATGRPPETVLRQAHGTLSEESISMGNIEPARLAVAWLTMFMVGTELFVFSPLLPVLAAGYHVAPASAGLSVTTFSLAYTVSAPLFGYFSDRVGRRRVLVCSLLAFWLANILTAGATNLPSLTPLTLVSGAPAAGGSPAVYGPFGTPPPPPPKAPWRARGGAAP